MKLLGLLAVVVILGVPAALAHAEPISMVPEANARLTTSPSEVGAYLSEDFHEDGSWVRVQNSTGARVDLPGVRYETSPPAMWVTVPPLPDGGYLVTWQTFSPSDGHVTRGAWGFAVGDAEPPAGQQDDQGFTGVGFVARALQYMGLTAVLGTVAFFVLVKREPLSPNAGLVDRFLLAGAGLHVLGIILLIADSAGATGLGWGGFMASVAGRAVVIRLLLSSAIVLLSALWLKGPFAPRFRYHILLLLWLAAANLSSEVGHAGGPIGGLVQMVHAIAMASWLGAVGWFGWWLISRPTDDEARTMLGKFSTFAAVAAIGGFVTGGLLSVQILGPAILTPAGGVWRAVLSAKIALVFLMLGLAAANRWYAAPRNLWGISQRLAWVEFGFGATALVLAGALMSLAPELP